MFSGVRLFVVSLYVAERGFFFIFSLFKNLLTSRPEFKMGKLRKKYNWKGRQQSDPQPSADGGKTEVVVELKGRKRSQTLNISWLLSL